MQRNEIGDGRGSSMSNFTHSPLDHSNSAIRLLSILPDLSSEGFIQCQVRSATLDSEYICLSYVWGEAFPSQQILLNGQLFWVRENLHSFLRHARRKSRIKWIWIDALCIDQANPRERNHQVQQMGAIFSNALEVISWLGDSIDIVWHLANVRVGIHCNDEGLRALNNSAYWNRAWITQELALAQCNTLMARRAELRIEDLPFSLTEGRYNERITDFKLANVKDRSLYYLLYKFKSKGCALPRDRVFSLLGLCSDVTSLKVDYEIPHVELARNVLLNCTSPLCLCAIRIICDALIIDSDEVNAYKPNEPDLFASCVFAVVKTSRPRVCSALSCKSLSGRTCNALNHRQRIALFRGRAWKSRSKCTLFVMSLQQLCMQHDGCLLILYDSNPNKIRFRYVQEYRSSDLSYDSELFSKCQDNDLRIHLSHDEKYCTFHFSFRFLIKVASMAARYPQGPCGKKYNMKTGLHHPEFGLQCPPSPSGEVSESTIPLLRYVYYCNTHRICSEPAPLPRVAWSPDTIMTGNFS